MTKKLRYLCTLLLCMIASVGWVKADNYNITFTTSSSDGSTEIKTTTQPSTVISDNAIYVSGFTGNCTKAYYKCKNGVKLSSSSVSGVLEFNIKDDYQNYIKSIKIISAKYGTEDSSISLYVNGETTALSTNINPGEEFVYTFENAIKISSIKLSSTKRSYISKIVLTSGEAPSTTATTTTIDDTGITNTDVYTSTAAGSLSATVTANNEAISGATVTWASSDEGVATIDANGAVTLVAAGTTTITATYVGVANQYQGSSATYILNVTDSTPFEGVIFKATEDKDVDNTSQGEGSITKDNVTFACTSGILGNGSEYRLYKNSTTTISTTAGSLITKIEFTGVSGNPSSGFGNQTGWTTSGNNGVWTGEAESVSFVASGAQVRATEIKVTVAENANPSINANNVEISYDATSGSINYSIEKTVNGGALTANTEDTWLTLGDVTADAVLFTTSENEAFTARTASIVLTYTYGESSIDKTITLTQAGNPNVPGTSSNPFTVAQANEFISSLDNNVNSEEVYVKGIISGIKSIDVSKYERAQYYISDDGNSTGQLLVYNGYYIGGVKFTANDQIQVGDNVVVYGSLVNYNGTYEVAQNNKLISLNRPEKPEAGLEYKTTDVTATRGVAFTAPELTNPNNLTVTYYSSNEAVATVNAEGAVNLLKAGETTITASFAGDANYKAGSASYTLTVTVPSHKATFFVNGNQQDEPSIIAEDEAITFPTAPTEINGKKFVGWTTAAIDGTTNDKPATLVNAATMGNADVTYYAVYAVREGEGVSSVTTLTNANIVAAGDGKDGYNVWTITDSDDRVWNARAIKNQHSKATSGYHYLQIKKSTDSEQFYIQVPEMGGTITAMTMTVSGSSQPMTGGSNSSTLFFSNSNLTSATGSGAVSGEGSSTVTLDCSSLGLSTGYITSSGAVRIWDVKVTYGTPATYSDYCTTVESEEPVVEPSVPAPITAGYYRIKNVGNGKYVNVAGRKTVTFVDNDATATAAGTVLKVESNDKGQVQVLRSQAIDLPGYADKAMKYVPEVVQLVVNKLHAEGSGAILGENGLDKIMEKFDASFDYHLYTEQAEGGIRIYGKTPSMRPVVEFYNENKDNVDAKLPMLEDFINDAINKILDKTGGRGSSILVPFSLHDVWKNMGSSLTEPKNDATKLTFLQEVLSNEQNVWDFAYQTAMIYWGKVKEHPRYDEFKGKLGDYAKYIDKIEYIRPNVKYYLATDGTNLDVLSQDNELVKTGTAALWALEERDDFQVTFDEKNVLNGKYYTTLYTDFAYTLPEGVKAYKVTKVSDAGVAVKVALESVPAQTPVLLESESAGAKTLTLNTDEGTAPTDNILVGADAIINEYDINESQVVSLFEFALEVLGESTYNEYLAKYEHLMDRNSGTVNNKFFFGLTTKELGEGADEEGLISARSLAMQDNLLGFYENWDVSANHAFLLNKDYDPVKLFLKGDIDRDGDVDNNDLKALVEIVLEKVTVVNNPDDYDFEAAHVNDDEDIDIADVTALVNILNTLQTQTNN